MVVFLKNAPEAKKYSRRGTSFRAAQGADHVSAILFQWQVLTCRHVYLQKPGQ